jgi:hypothetical protein
MSGFLNSSPNSLSRVTVAALADMGYSVNHAVADPYAKPTSVSTFVGSPSNGGVAGRRAAYSASDPNTAQVWIPMETSPPSRPAAKSVQPVRRPALSAASTRFDEEVMAAALTATYKRGNTEQTDDLFVRDERDGAKFSPATANDQFFAQLGKRGAQLTSA